MIVICTAARGKLYRLREVQDVEEKVRAKAAKNNTISVGNSFLKNENDFRGCGPLTVRTV